MNNPLLRVEDVHKMFVMGPARVGVLRGASFEAERGEFLVIRGASGSGKSTLLHICGALDRPDRGTVSFSGSALHKMGARGRDNYRNHDVGFVFQFYHLLPELTVLENVLLPSMVGYSLLQWGRARGVARRAALEIIERVGLSHRVTHRPRELSGGERQRVAIARALISRPALLLADEPTGNLDASIGGEILDVLCELNAAGQTIVMVTHDANVAARAHRQVHLAEGTLHPTGETGGKKPINHPRTEQVTQ